MILIHIRTVLLAHEFGRKWDSLIWERYTLRSIIWRGRFDIIFDWVRINILIILFGILFSVYGIITDKRDLEVTYLEIPTYLTLFYLLAPLNHSLCHCQSILRLIWGDYCREHENEMLLGILVDLMYFMVVKL